jgi:uncharacterized membrane protein
MHPQVLFFGLLAALLAGVADFLAALVSRKLGSFLTLLYMIGSSAVILILIQALRVHESWLSWQDTALMFAVGGAALAGYLAFYRGLALGPVAVVSPIAACDGAVAALIGVALLGERLGAGHYLAIALLVAGVALAATDLRELRKGLQVSSRGPLLALVTMVGFGIAIAGLTWLAARCQSFLVPVLTLRCCIFVQMATLAGVRGTGPLLGGGLGVVLAAVAVGLLDTGSLLALAQGMIAQADARVALLGPLYGAYPVITILLSLLFLRERLAVNQWAGVGLALVGTVVVAL